MQKYALACARNRPTDTVFMQKTFFEIMKQHQGEYMGSLLSGVCSSRWAALAPDMIRTTCCSGDAMDAA